MNERIFGVSELNEYIKRLVDSDPLLTGIYVRGELSNYKVYPSGHHYFTMKDETGALKCVMFRSSASTLRFRPESGMKVIALGRITVYPRDGAYQLYVNSLVPDGVGDLQAAFEQLKEKLYKEGLFDAEHKKPLPKYPMTVAVVTSSAGAAVHDIIRVLRKRWPIAKIKLLPVRVQGEEAPMEIVGAIKYANVHNVADVMIVGRGGGSMEDLWAFNDERVARAIYDSHIPVISAVGHEPDVTISDFVADLRAATPSNGAELCAPDREEIMEYLDSLSMRCAQVMEKKIDGYRQRLKSYAERSVMIDPKNYVLARRTALENYSSRLLSAVNMSIAAKKALFSENAAKLDTMSPLKVLARGYSIMSDGMGTAVKSIKDVSVGDKVSVMVLDGTLDCVIEDKNEEIKKLEK